MRLLVVAPNWLGDAVMAIPVVHELRRHDAAAEIVVAARPHVASIFEHVDGVNRVIATPDRAWRNGDRRGEIEQLREVRADVALLLPNSFRSAWTVWKADVPERWGYRRDLRGRLLTKAVDPPRKGLHQAEYYLELLRRLGWPAGSPHPVLHVGEAMREQGRELLRAAGWDTVMPLVGIAPGAAYGSAKRWPLGHVARLVELLHNQTSAIGVLFASPQETEIVAAIERELRGTRRAVNLAGRTDLRQLMAAASWCRTFVSNDSGAMHIASALGLPVIAVFGPTREYETGPLSAGAGAPGSVVLTNPVWCRPCMLRACPIDHRCMTGITPERVLEQVKKNLFH
ncbi:MAG: lipopolysaccharide heptosyltransferase II, partial [Acidobacteria bacterium]|nr:lipopolysaccharide heptosyltransferase II [Acidobacteriota bacterium]